MLATKLEMLGWYSLVKLYHWFGWFSKVINQWRVWMTWTIIFLKPKETCEITKKLRYIFSGYRRCWLLFYNLVKSYFYVNYTLLYMSGLLEMHIREAATNMFTDRIGKLLVQTRTCVRTCHLFIKKNFLSWKWIKLLTTKKFSCITLLIWLEGKLITFGEKTYHSLNQHLDLFVKI